MHKKKNLLWALDINSLRCSRNTIHIWERDHSITTSTENLYHKLKHTHKLNIPFHSQIFQMFFLIFFLFFRISNEVLLRWIFCRNRTRNIKLYHFDIRSDNNFRFFFFYVQSNRWAKEKKKSHKNSLQIRSNGCWVDFSVFHFLFIHFNNGRDEWNFFLLCFVPFICDRKFFFLFWSEYWFKCHNGNVHSGQVCFFSSDNQNHLHLHSAGSYSRIFIYNA